MSRPLFAATAVAVALGAAAPAFADDASDWAAVVAAAKKEGSVNLYTSDVASKCGPQRSKAFTAKYGIEVQTYSAPGVTVDEKVRTEQVAGRYLGDIYYNGGAPAYVKAQEGMIVPHGPLPNMANLQPAYQQTDGIRIVYQDNLFSFVVNTDLVKPGEEPKTWKDLVDPKWKGKILSDDIRVPGAGMGSWQALYKVYGAEFAQAFVDQQLTFDRDVGNSIRRAASGEFAIYLPLLSLYNARTDGLPLKYILPTDGDPENQITIAMLKSAPHPNAARVLLDFYLDKEWQANCANEGGRGTVVGLEPMLNPFAKAVAEEKLMPPQDFGAEATAKWVAMAKAAVKY